MSYISKWRLQNNSVVPVGSNLFGTCSSGASDTTKVVSLPAFDVLVEGVTIHVYFANANSGSNTLLQVGSTSAQPIKRNGIAEGKWENDSVISFTYSQGYWVQNDADVGGIAETYTLSKTGDTITLTGSGGDTSSVTDDDTTYTIAVNGHTLTLTPSSGSTQSITLPDNDTTYTFTISGHTLTITPSNGTPQTITLPDDNTTYTLSISGDVLTLTGSDGSTNVINLPKLQYTIDGADGLTTNNVIQNDVANNVADGGYALAQGQQTTASGVRSHAEGYRTTASGSSSHAEGVDSEASGNHSHAEGNATEASGSGSHAEGSHTEASNDQAHAEGYYSVASAPRSHATNHYTIAQRADQTAIGRFNVADTAGADETALGDYAFIIGNGTADNARSNAFTVDWEGNVNIPAGAEYMINGVPIGSGNTYTLTKSGDTITLTGSGGDVSSVLDEDTTYTMSVSGHNLTLSGSDGSTSTAILPDNNTTYTMSISGDVLTLTPSSGSAQTVTLPIPTKTSDLVNDSNFVSDANYVHTDNNFTTAEKNKLSGIEAGAEVNVQSDWNQTNSSADDYIKNKPTIPTPPSPTTTTPIMDGTADVGSETTYARGDHVHPSDTSKQDTLVSGTNIKTINNTSLLGSGNIDISGAFIAEYGVTAFSDLLDAVTAEKPIIIKETDYYVPVTVDTYYLNSALVMYGVYNAYQTPRLVIYELDSGDTWARDVINLQEKLISGTNIKTVNGNSLLGSGNIVIPGGGGTSDYDSLTNRPQINSVTLTGNKSFVDLGLIDFFYPVGSYYETSDSSFDPNVTWGGTWVLEADGLVHIGAGSRYAVGDTGGEETHTLTFNEMPSHNHNTKGEYVYYGSGGNTGTILLWANGSAAVQQTGGNVPHNIMQPYVAVNRWHRTA